MEKCPVLVAMSNQKGGVGKSTLLVVLASYLHFEKNKNVAVVDCDSPQHSLSNLRERDKKVVMEDERFQLKMMEQYERIKKKAYPIICAKTEDARVAAEVFIHSKDPQYDVIFFDMPGTLDTKGVLSLIINTDYVITPIMPDKMVMASTLSFAKSVLNFTKTRMGIPLKNIFFLWNRIDGRVSDKTMKMFQFVMKKMDLTELNTIIPERNRYGKEIQQGEYDFFRCTLLPPSKSLIQDSGLDKLAEEICELIKI